MKRSTIAYLLCSVGLLTSEQPVPGTGSPVTLRVNGDFDGDGVLTANDVDLISMAVPNGTQSPRYDVNGDGRIDRQDVETMLTWAQRLPGDADFDGTVQLLDFLVVADNFDQAGRKWSEGDFNSDGSVTMHDFLMLAENFGASVADLNREPAPSHFSMALGITFIWLASNRVAAT